jgi:hypothetical protein
MRTAITASALAVLALACGPSIADEREPLGTLEHEYGPWTGGGHGWASGEWYRLDRRIELVPEQNPYLRPMCGTLTDAAYDELEATIAALDPSVDYPPPPTDVAGRKARRHASTSKASRTARSRAIGCAATTSSRGFPASTSSPPTSSPRTRSRFTISRSP